MSEREVLESMKISKIIERQLNFAEEHLANAQERTLTKGKRDIGEIIKNIEKSSFFLGNSIAHINCIQAEKVRYDLKSKYDTIQRTMNNFIFNINSYLGE